MQLRSYPPNYVQLNKLMQLHNYPPNYVLLLRNINVCRLTDTPLATYLCGVHKLMQLSSNLPDYVPLSRTNKIMQIYSYPPNYVPLSRTVSQWSCRTRPWWTDQPARCFPRPDRSPLCLSVFRNKNLSPFPMPPP